MKLRTKFSILTCTLAVIIVTAVSSFLYIEERKMLLNEIRESKISSVKALAKVSSESLISANEILLINYIKQLSAEDSVVYAMVASPDGTILAHSDIQRLGQKADSRLRSNTLKDRHKFFSYTENSGDEISAVAFPVKTGGKTEAISWIGYSKKAIDEVIERTLKNTRKRILGVSVFGLGLGFLGAVFLSITMTRPIKKMAAGANLIGQGKLDTVIEVSTKDELGSLAKDLNAMARKLAELDEMKQDFVSSITHEFRSPLNAMAIHFDLLFKERLGQLNDKQKESLLVLRNNAKRLEKFINDLLDMAKIEKGKMEITPEEFNPSEIVSEIHQLYSVHADEKNINFSVYCPPDIPPVYADPDRTRQVLTNLVNNALKFTSENGQVTVTVSRENDFVQFAVKDNGIGIPEEQLNTVFNKFEQVKGIRKKITGQKGTGLGLSIVKGIVEGQGGKIRVESKTGEGSVFYFTLPVVKK